VLKFGKRHELDRAKGLRASKDVDWIMWGKDNNYPEKFLNRLNDSAIYHRVTTTQVNMCVGEGLSFSGTRAEQAERYFDEIGIDMNFLKRVAWDVCVFNAVAMQVLRSRATTIFEVLHCRSDKVRVDKHLDEFDRVQSYWLAKDWSVIDKRGNVSTRYIKENKEEYMPVNIERYNSEMRQDRSLIYNAEYNPAMMFYPVPPAEPAFKELELAIKVIDFQDSAIDNGMAGTLIVKYPKKQAGDQETEANQRKDIVEKLHKGFAGAQNAGTAVVLFYDPEAEGDGKSGMPQVEKFPLDENDERYIEMNKLIKEAIYSGLGVVSSELFGIPASGGFSSQSDMLLTANELTYHNVIRPRQKLILDPLNMLLKDSGFQDVEVEIMNSLPVSNRLEMDMVSNEIVTRDEYRDSLGLEPYPIDEEEPRDEEENDDDIIIDDEE